MRSSQVFTLVVMVAACGADRYDSTSSAVVGIDAATSTKPHSTITVRVEEARTNSILKTPAELLHHCSIPGTVLKDTPLYTGEPAMAQCDLKTTITGDPPTSIQIKLECDDGTNGASKVSMFCLQNISLVPPKATSTGSFYFGSKDVALTAAACDAYLARATSICETTGVVADEAQ